MLLIIGGAYNGKLKYAISNFNVVEEDVYDFNNKNFDIGDIPNIINRYKCLYNIHILVKKIIENKFDINMLYKIFDSCIDNIVISDDISCGIVPIDSFNRKYREEISKFLTFLSKKSKDVYRIYAGLALKIK